MIHGFVTSRLGYCNSLFFGLYEYQIKYSIFKMPQLDWSPRGGWSLILTWRPSNVSFTASHSSYTLSWRKILCITFKIIRYPESAPQYLADLVIVHVPRVWTKSCNGLKLTASKFRPRTNAYGNRAFEVYAPMLWKRLPVDAINETLYENFKNKLKTLCSGALITNY